MGLRAFLAGLVMVSAVSPLAAQPLDEAVRTGLRTNPALQAESARVEAVAEAIAEARAAGRPTVSLSGRSSYGVGTFEPGADAEEALGAFFGPGGAGQMGPDVGQLLGTEDGRVTSQAELSVVQPIFTGFQIKNGIEEAEAAVAAARAQLYGARQGYAYRIVESYLGVVMAEAQIAAVSKSVESLGQARRATEVSFDAGRSTRTDVALADAQLSAARAQLAAAQAQAVSARQDFAVVGGDTIVNFSLPESGLPIADDVNEAVDAALANHPDLIAARANEASAKAAVRGAKGARSPTVQVRGTLSYADGQFFNDDRSENASIAAEVSVPIFEGGAIRAGVRRAEAEERAARFAGTDAQRQVVGNVRSAWAAYQAAGVSAEAASARLDAAELAWRGIQLEREVGQRSILDVLRVEEDLLDAQMAQINARADLVRASWRLGLATGMLEIE